MSGYIPYLMSSAQLETAIAEAKKQLTFLNKEISNLTKKFNERKHIRTEWVTNKATLKRLTELYDQSCEIMINLELLKCKQ